MNDPIWLTGGPLKEAIGWTLVHSIWQFALLALILYVVLRFIPRKKAEFRYVLLLTGLFLGLAWVGITFFQEWQDTTALATRPVITNPVSPVDLQAAPALSLSTPSLWDKVREFSRQLDTYTPVITLTWLSGLVLFSLYLLFGLGYLKYLEYTRIALPDNQWQTRLNALAKQMGVKRQVRLLVSRYVDEPITFQLFKPVIMVPVFFFTGLTPAQMEVLLLHELAHIRRHDFTINLLQSLIEILFFFHPAVWWLSGSIREEREYCCDNAVLAVQETPFPYVEALTRIQSTQFSHKNRLAMSANGKHSMLSKRVFRLFGRYDQEPSRLKSTVFALLLLTVGFSAQAFLVPEHQAVELASLPVLEASPAPVEPTEPVAEITEEPVIERPATPAQSAVVPAAAEPEMDIIRDTLPLFVIDGVTKERNYTIQNLKPDNIASITVLKDEKALEKYGQAGEFGVIEITTKGTEPAKGDQKEIMTKEPAPEPQIRISKRSESGDLRLSGKVIDLGGQPMVGVNILIKGTRTGTITDFTGEFVITLPEDCATLVFSYVGMQTKELEGICAIKEPINVVMKPTAADIKENIREGGTDITPAATIISGRVLNKAQQPMIGANIIVKGTTVGTITDLQGDFMIKLPSDCASLVISYIGMKSHLLENLCKDQEVNITLEEQVDEVASPVVKPGSGTINAMENSRHPAILDLKVFPNPADELVTVELNLKEKKAVKLSVFSLDGKLIKTLATETVDAGLRKFQWTPLMEQRGTFLIQLEIEGKVSSKQIVVE